MCVCVKLLHSVSLIEGSEKLQLAKATQLPTLLSQQIGQLEASEVQLREMRADNAHKLQQQHPVRSRGESKSGGLPFSLIYLPFSDSG